MSGAHTEPRPGRRGRLAAAASLAAIAVVAVVGVAGAAQERAPATVYIADSAAGQCFTTVAGKPACAPGDRGDVTIDAGETVTWNFAGPPSAHNAKATNSVAADPGWATFATPYVTTGSGTYSRQFDAPGSYDFVCFAHPSMVGTITVLPGSGTGTPTPTATATATASATATATATATAAATATPIAAAATATPDNHVQTPAPGGAVPVKDTVAPRLASTSLKGLKGAVSVRFWLSEPATVVISAKRRGSRTVLSSATVHANAGNRTVTLRSKRLKKGTYTVELRAADAMGNRSAATTKSVRLKR